MRCHVQQPTGKFFAKIFFYRPEAAFIFNRTYKTYRTYSQALSSQSEFIDYLVILIDITTLEVIKQFPATRDHYKQAATRVVVLFMYLEMFRQLIDPLRQQRDLHLRRTRVYTVGLVVAYYLFF